MYLLALALLLTWTFPVRFAQSMPLVLTGAALLTYLCTAVGQKDALRWLLPLIGLAAAAWLYRRGKAKKLRKSAGFSPALLAFLLAMVPAFLCTGHLQLTIFDDVAHWGLFTRQISGIDYFPNAAQSASTLADYPPGIQMLTALLHLSDNARAEVSTMFTGQLLWYFGLTLPLLGELRWTKKAWQNLLLVLGGAAFLLVFPAFFTKYHQMSLVVEPVMALLLGWALLTAWRSPQPGLLELASVSCGLSVLAISKSTGPLYAFTGLAAVALLWWEPLKKTFAKGAARWTKWITAAAFAAPPAFWLSWQVLCRLKGTSSYFSQDVAGGAYSLANLVEFFTGQGDAGPVIRHYLEYFCLSPLNRGTGLSALAFLLLFWGMVWALCRLAPQRRKTLLRLSGLLTGVLLAYAVMLCYSYLYLFDPDEAQQLAAYHRYIMPLPTAMIYLGLGALSVYAGRLCTRKRQLAALACTAAAFGLCVNWVAATELVPSLFLSHRQLDAEEAQWAREEAQLEGVFEAIPDQLRQDDASMLILTEDPSWSHYARLYKYDLAPGHTLALNPVEHGGSQEIQARYREWAAQKYAVKTVYCAWNGEVVASAASLVDSEGAPLRANTLYRLEPDGSLTVWMQLPAPAV